MTAQSALLAPGDPPAFELCNAQARVRGLLICDHASAAIPAALGNLGLDEGQRRLHIAWDIGAGDVTRRLSQRLGVAAILSGYSRLVIDCNRQLDDPTSIPQESDGVDVPGNRGLSSTQRKQRAEACFWPYQQAIEGWIAARRSSGEQPIIVSLHSFTPVMDGFERPWHIGILANRDRRVAQRLIGALRRDTTLNVGDNEPYDGRHGRGYGMMVHGEEMGLPFALIEMRQDLIDTHHGAEAWAQRLAPILAQIFAEGVDEEIEA